MSINLHSFCQFALISGGTGTIFVSHFGYKRLFKFAISNVIVDRLDSTWPFSIFQIIKLLSR